jgi:hypothetical protein
MMAHTSTAEIDRSISRFISRGNEIAKHEPTTSYYCKLRATELLMETKPRPDDLIRKLLEELEVRFLTLLGVSFSLLSLSFLRGGARGVVFETMRYTKTCRRSYYSYCFFLSFSQTRRDGRKNIKAPQVAFD